METLTITGNLAAARKGGKVGAADDNQPKRKALLRRSDVQELFARNTPDNKSAIFGGQHEGKLGEREVAERVGQ